MYVLLFVFGLLLVLFGGGCTVLFFGMEARSEFLWLWLALGLAPLVGGLFLIRHGLRLHREKQKGKTQ